MEVKPEMLLTMIGQLYVQTVVQRQEMDEIVRDRDGIKKVLADQNNAKTQEIKK
jgi:hypothetical protein